MRSGYVYEQIEEIPELGPNFHCHIVLRKNYD